MENSYFDYSNFEGPIAESTVQRFAEEHTNGSPYETLTPTHQAAVAKFLGVTFLVLGLISGAAGAGISLLFGGIGSFIFWATVSLGGIFVLVGISMLLNERSRDIAKDWEHLYRWHEFIHANELTHHRDGTGQTLPGALFDGGPDAHARKWSHVLSGHGRRGHYFEFGAYSFETSTGNSDSDTTHYCDYLALYVGPNYTHNLLTRSSVFNQFRVDKQYRRELNYDLEGLALYSSASQRNTEHVFDWDTIMMFQEHFPDMHMELVDGWLLFFRMDASIPQQHAEEAVRWYGGLLEFVDETLSQRLPYLDYTAPGNSREKFRIKTFRRG